MKATGIVRRIDELGRVSYTQRDTEDAAYTGGRAGWRYSRTGKGEVMRSEKIARP